MRKDKSVLDIDDALNRALGDVAFLQMMFEEFQQIIPEAVSRLSDALSSGNMQQIAMDAHQLKGAAANLGAVAIASAALTLEKIGNSGHSDGAAQALEKMQLAVERFKEHLADIDWPTLGES